MPHAASAMRWVVALIMALGCVVVLADADAAAGSSVQPNGPMYDAQLVGGTDAVDPWRFVAQVILSHGPGPQSFCGGTLIAPKWVITAAHCVVPADKAAVVLGGSVVRLGSNLYGSGTAHPIASFIVHPDYHPLYDGVGKPIDIDAGDDIALVELSVAATETSLAMIDAGSLHLADANSPVTVYGWGVTRSDGLGPASPTLRQGAMTVVLPESRGYSPFPTELWTESTTVSACFGDSGGPVVAAAGDGTHRLVGVISGGPNCHIHLSPFEQDFSARLDQKLGWIIAAITPPPTVIPPVPTGPPTRFEPVAPERLLDTRLGLGGSLRPGAGQTLQLQVTGRAGVPIGATVAVINVAADVPSGPGYVTAFPCDRAMPTAANLNFVKDVTVANLVTAPLSADGRVCLYTYESTDLIIDVTGYAAPTATQGFAATGPDRIADTRSARPVAGPIPAGATLQLVIAGLNAVPVGASAVVLNVTATEPVSAGHVTVYPCNGAVPNVAALNYLGGKNVPNLVVVPLAADGTVCLSSYATTHLVVDLMGWFGPTGTKLLTPLTPARLLDTRIRLSGTRVSAQGVLTLNVRSLAVLTPDTYGAVLNITAVDPAGAGYLTAYPCDRDRPSTSNVNYAEGQNSPNSVYIPFAADGSICIFTWAASDLVVDISGSFA